MSQFVFFFSSVHFSFFSLSLFFFNDTATTEIYTLSLHDALPILGARPHHAAVFRPVAGLRGDVAHQVRLGPLRGRHSDRRMGYGRGLPRRHRTGYPPNVASHERSRPMNLLLRGAAIAAVLHITPAVVLVKRPDAVQALLPGADTYLARDVHLSDPDAHRLHELVDWSPEDGVLTFYSGKAGTTGVGALTFVRVDTPHGPIEVAVGFTPRGAVRGVIVTKATVEMKPWVLEAVGAGLVRS